MEIFINKADFGVVVAKIYFKPITDNVMFIERNFSHEIKEFQDEEELRDIMEPYFHFRDFYILFYDRDQIIISSHNLTDYNSISIIEFDYFCRGVDLIFYKGYYDFLEESMMEIGE